VTCSNEAKRRDVQTRHNGGTIDRPIFLIARLLSGTTNKINNRSENYVKVIIPWQNRRSVRGLRDVKRRNLREKGIRIFAFSENRKRSNVYRRVQERI